MLRLHRPATPQLDIDRGASLPRTRRRVERRRFPRTPLNQVVGLDAPGLATRADLLDGSAGGLLLRINGIRRLRTGETVTLNFDAGGRGGPARTDAHHQVRVVRCLGHADACYVAVAFSTSNTLRLRSASFG